MCNHPNLRRAIRRGFTLVEILVVVMILGIATAIVVPHMSGMGDLQASAGVRTLLANMQYAQNEAIVSQRSISVAFDLTNHAYDLRYNDNVVLTHPVDKDPFIVRFAETPGMSNVTILSAGFNGNTYVTFDSLGAPDNNGQVTLISDGHMKRITVAPVTGRMSVATVTP